MSAKQIQVPLLVEVHLLIRPDVWTETVDALENELHGSRRHTAALLPLYLSYDLEDLEVRVCFLVYNVVALEHYIVAQLRVLRGVRETRVRLTLNGTIFPDNLRSMLSRGAGKRSAHVFIENTPAEDEAVWESLSHLPSKRSGVSPVWIFRDFYDYKRTITLRVVGSSADAIREYVERSLRSVRGITSWRLKFMARVVYFRSKTELSRLAARFLGNGGFRHGKN